MRSRLGRDMFADGRLWICLLWCFCVSLLLSATAQSLPACRAGGTVCFADDVPAVYGAAGTVVGNVIYSHGGCRAPETDAFQLMPENCVAADGLMLQLTYVGPSAVGHGRFFPTSGQLLTDTVALDLFGHTITAWRGSLVLFGGSHVGGDTISNSVLQLNLTSLEWSVLSAGGVDEDQLGDTPAARYFHRALVIGDQLFVTGGLICSWSAVQSQTCTTAIFDYTSVYVFDLQNRRWLPSIPIPQQLWPFPAADQSNATRALDSFRPFLRGAAIAEIHNHLILHLWDKLALLDLSTYSENTTQTLNWSPITLNEVAPLNSSNSNASLRPRMPAAPGDLGRGLRSSTGANLSYPELEARLVIAAGDLHITLFGQGFLGSYRVPGFEEAVEAGNITVQVLQNAIFTADGEGNVLHASGQLAIANQGDVPVTCAWAIQGSPRDGLPIPGAALFEAFPNGDVFLALFSQDSATIPAQASYCRLSTSGSTPRLEPLLAINGLQPPPDSNFLGAVLKRVPAGTALLRTRPILFGSSQYTFENYIDDVNLETLARATGGVEAHLVPASAGSESQQVLLIGYHGVDEPPPVVEGEDAMPLLLWDVTKHSTSRFDALTCKTEKAGLSALLRFGDVIAQVRHEVQFTRADFGIYEWNTSKPMEDPGAHRTTCLPTWSNLTVRSLLAPNATAAQARIGNRDPPATLLAIGDDSLLAWAEECAFLLKFSRSATGTYSITSTLIPRASCPASAAAVSVSPSARFQPGLVFLAPGSSSLTATSRRGQVALLGGSQVSFVSKSTESIADEQALSDLWLLDLDTLTWRTVVTSNLPTLRLQPSLTTLGSTLYLHGGLGSDPLTWTKLTDLWSLDLLAEPTWKRAWNIPALQVPVENASYYDKPSRLPSIYNLPVHAAISIPTLQALVIVHPNRDVLLIPLHRSLEASSGEAAAAAAMTLIDGDTLTLSVPNMRLVAPILIQAQGVHLQGMTSATNGRRRMNALQASGTVIDCAGQEQGIVVVGNNSRLDAPTTSVSDVTLVNCTRNAIEAYVAGQIGRTTVKLGLLLQRVQLHNNSGPDGAGLLVRAGVQAVLKDLQITQNQATDAHGAAVMMQADSMLLSVTGSQFHDNLATALAIIDPPSGSTTISDCIFEHNASPASGGAIRVLQEGAGAQLLSADGEELMADVWMLSIQNSQLSYNTADLNGGGIFFQSSVSPLYLDNVTVDFNHASGSGGGTSFTSGAGSLRIGGTASCSFSSNSAHINGGAVFAVTGLAQSAADFQGMAVATSAPMLGTFATTFSDNEASTGNGGAIYHNSPGSLTIGASGGPTAVFQGNQAPHGSGGAVYVGTQVDARLINARLIDNTAGLLGGGLACQECSSLVVTDSLAQANTARTGGGLAIATPATKVNISRSMLRDNSATSVDVAQATQHTWADGSGAGGGLFLNTSIPGSIDDVLVLNNTARFGGGAVIMSGLNCTQTHPASCVYLQGVSFVNNTAQGGPGGGVFITKPSSVAISCNAGDLPLNLKVAAGPGGCSNLVVGNLASLYGNDISTMPVSLKAQQPSLPTLASRQAFDVELALRDIQGQHVQLAPPAPIFIQAQVIRCNGVQDEELCSQNIDILGGRSRQAVQSGPDAPLWANFSATSLLAEPGMYTVRFSDTDSQLATADVDVNIRDCWVGERRVSRQCENCSAEHFNFQYPPRQGPLVTCRPCPKRANCSLGILKPSVGAWVSHPRSPQVHRCLHKAACLQTYHNDPDALATLQLLHRSEWDVNISSPFVAEYRQAQCSPGYTGNLCGVCQEGYGKNGARCVKCKGGKGAAGFLQFLAILLPVAILVIQSAAAIMQGGKRLARAATARMSAAQEAVRAVDSPSNPTSPRLGEERVLDKKDMSNRNMNIGADATSRHMDIGADATSSKVLGANPAASWPVDGAAEGDAGMTTGKVLPKAKEGGGLVMGLPVETPASPTSTLASGLADRVEMSELDVKSMRLVGSFKILLDYVQLLGILRTIQLNWPTNVLTFLTIWDVTSVASSSPLYCSLTGSPRHRILAWIVISVGLPVIFACAAVGVFLLAAAVLAAVRLRMPQMHLPRPLHTYIITCLIAITIFFYAPTTRHIMAIFSFVSLDKWGEDYEPHVQASLGTFWIEFPDMQYAKGTHAILIWALGIPGVVLFSVGAPVGIFLYLWASQKKLHTPEFMATNGLLYEDYKPEFYFWQCVVLVRQLLLVLCTVYMRPLSVTVQVLTTLVVVALYTHAQVLLQPFAVPGLSAISGWALLAVQITLMLLLYMETQLDANRRAISALVVLLNVVTALYVTAHIIAAGLVLVQDSTVKSQFKSVRHRVRGLMKMPTKLRSVMSMRKSNVTSTSDDSSDDSEHDAGSRISPPESTPASGSKPPVPASEGSDSITAFPLATSSEGVAVHLPESSETGEASPEVMELPRSYARHRGADEANV